MMRRWRNLSSARGADIFLKDTLKLVEEYETQNIRLSSMQVTDKIESEFTKDKCESGFTLLNQYRTIARVLGESPREGKSLLEKLILIRKDHREVEGRFKPDDETPDLNQRPQAGLHAYQGSNEPKSPWTARSQGNSTQYRGGV